jgi:Eco57I restriction-modification methylase
VSSLRHAAALLARTRAFADLQPIIDRLGFGAALPLDAAARRALGLKSAIRRASVASGPGTLRALMLEVRAGAPMRDELSRTAARLAAHSPHLLWLVVAVQPATHLVVILAPAPGTTTRVHALAVDALRVVDSDAESFAAMSAASAGADLLVHHRWRELLGRDALTRRFYRELERVVFDLGASARGDAPAKSRSDIALLYASRLLFLAFLEAKGWLNDDRGFLRRSFDECCSRGTDVHRTLLEPLFFGTLNTPVSRRAATARALGRIPFLNGGLFSRTPLEKRYRAVRFPNDAIGALIGGLLSRFRVTAREDSTAWSEAAVDPEMLGRAFESLMASDERRASGAYYTPSAIISRVAGEGLEEALSARGAEPELVRMARDGATLPQRERGRLGVALAGVRVLDPACGSGAFLVYALEQLAELRHAAGDTSPVGDRRRDVLTNCIFGVDVNPTAVWLCELRLWLSVVIDSGECDPLEVTPLPNLDRHVRVGDTLAGPAFDEAFRVRAPMAVARLRDRYARSTGARKRSLARALDREERRGAILAAERELGTLAARRRDLLAALRSRDLFADRTTVAPVQRRELDALRLAARAVRRSITALRAGAPLPFSFPVHFADVAGDGGFDLIVGNPPWVRLHHIPPAVREALRASYRSLREAAWMPGAVETGAGRAFAAQADLASLFVERSLSLARAGGAVALLLPAKLWRALAGGGVRAVLADSANLRAVEDWSESRVAFDAVVYPSFLLARRRERGAPASMAAAAPASRRSRRPSPGEPDVRIAIHRRDDMLVWRLPRSALPLDETRGAPWLLLPPEVRAAFDHVVAAGTPLARSPLGRPLLGVKSGCNDAFIVTPRPGWRESGEQVWPVRDSTREGCVETALLRPLLRGESVRQWHARPDDAVLLWTHDSLDAPRAHLPAGASAWLAPWRRRLESRSDAHARARWWSLFRTEAARSDRPRVVWSDIGRSPRALVLRAGDPTVPLNSCYVVRAASHDDALALCALLNSPVAAAWLAAIAEPARGGYHRYLGWTMSRFPVPRDWGRAVRHLAPLARDAIAGAPPAGTALADAVIRAYRVRSSSLAPLISWCLR